MHTYLFYDIETTGLNKAFDQVLRFAAIRTDPQLKEIERYEIPVRLRPDIILSPGALITHRISLKEAQLGQVEYEATQHIHQLFNTPGTISVGYNNLGFDDEFLRFSFYRNLLPPYTHQYSNGCGRMDILPLAVIYRLYKEEVLTWPEINGQPVLKLELLSQLNRLSEGRAHDAMADVEATMALAKVFSKEKKIWGYLTENFDKQIDSKRISNLPTAFQTVAGRHVKGLLVSHELGPDLNYQAPILFIGHSIPYSNQSLWLRLDQPELQHTTPDSIDEHSWVVRKRFGESPFILPPLNRYWRHLSSDRAQTAEDNLAWLMDHRALFEDIVRYHQQYRYPDIPNVDADAALYQMGFLSKSEEKMCREFHAASLPDKAELIVNFRRKELRTLSQRILYRNYTDRIPESLRKEFAAYMDCVHPSEPNSAMVDYKGGFRTTPSDAIEEIKSIRDDDDMDASQKLLLGQLSDYINHNFIDTPFS